MITSNTCLVKYDNPVLISKTEGRASTSKARSSGTGSGGTQVKQNPAEQRSKETEEILNKILPPQEWNQNNQLWRQCVSATPATRLDVCALQEQLEVRLQQREARETGICPIRRELYSQCFDELIRQVTIICAERGLLLLRVRDEIKMTLDAYQTLYESSVAFGMRTALSAAQNHTTTMRTSHELETEIADLQRKVSEERRASDETAKREAERRNAEETRHQEEVLNLKNSNAGLKAQLDTIFTVVKK